MKIVIPDDYQNFITKLKCYNIIKDFVVVIYNDSVEEEDELVNRFKDADCIVLTRERTRITKELISRLPNLKLISQTGKAANHIDVEACTKNNIAIAEGRGSPIAPAELTWLLIMASMRELIPAVNKFKSGEWQTNIGEKLEGKTLGIWGYGKIGKRIATYGRAFNMNVFIWGSPSAREKAMKEGFAAAESKKQFFENSDVLTLHLRLVDATKEIVKYNDLILMKKDALFVNTSRAELVENSALQRALIKGNPGRAAIDVFENEPIYDTNHWALQMGNVLCTPHLGYVEKNGYEYYFGLAFKNIVDFFNGKPANILNTFK